MKRSVIIGIAFLFTLVSTASLAQEPWQSEGELEDEVVVIEKAKQIELPPANRLFQKIPPIPKPKPDLAQQYQFETFSFRAPESEPILRVLRLKAEPQRQLFGNYATLGFGNYLSPLAEAGIYNKRNDDYLLGLHLRHFSSRQGPVDKVNSGVSHNSLQVSGKAFSDPVTISGHVGYKRDLYRFFGYPDSLEVEEDTIRHIFNNFYAEVVLANSSAEDFLNYELTGDFSYLSDNFDARESQFGLTLQSDYEVSEGLHTYLNGDLTYLNYKDGSSQNRIVLNVKPQIGLVRDRFSFKAGFNVAYENDSSENASQVHFYPLLSGRYQLSDQFEVFADLTGEIQKVGLHELVRENPYLGAQIATLHTNAQYILEAGIKGKPLPVLGFAAGIQLATYQNMYFFVNRADDRKKFDVIYDDGNTNLFNFYTEISLYSGERFTSLLRGDYFNYGPETLVEPWHKPQYQLDWQNKYNLFDKILLEADLYLMGGIKGRAPDGTAVDLSTIADMHLGVNYLFSDRALAFVKCYNLFGKSYERYLYYPSRKLQVMVGFTYKF